VVKLERGASLFVFRPVGAIDQQNVLPAIAVIVEKGATGTERFRKELASKGTTVVLKAKARGNGDIGKAKAER